MQRAKTYTHPSGTLLSPAEAVNLQPGAHLAGSRVAHTLLIAFLGEWFISESMVAFEDMDLLFFVCGMSWRVSCRVITKDRTDVAMIATTYQQPPLPLAAPGTCACAPGIADVCPSV